MILTTRLDETRAHYALARWAWYARNKCLIQRIPNIEETTFSGAGIPSIKIQPEHICPSLQMGQAVTLDNKELYVANVEVAHNITNEENETLYVYTMSETRPELPIFWSTVVEVKND